MQNLRPIVAELQKAVAQLPQEAFVGETAGHANLITGLLESLSKEVNQDACSCCARCCNTCHCGYRTRQAYKNLDKKGPPRGFK